MKKIVTVLVLLVSVSLNTFSKKDIDAWKNEKNLDQQYVVFKENLNQWNGSFFFKELQIDQFYGALKDSVKGLESKIQEGRNQVATLQNELEVKTSQLEEVQLNLEESNKQVNSIRVLGMYINKSAYTLFMFLVILGLAVLSGIVFLLYKRSNKITVYTKNEYNELKEEFEVYKKNSMERYTKLNRELHDTRMELKRI